MTFETGPAPSLMENRGCVWLGDAAPLTHTHTRTPTAPLMDIYLSFMAGRTQPPSLPNTILSDSRVRPTSTISQQLLELGMEDSAVLIWFKSISSVACRVSGPGSVRVEEIKCATETRGDDGLGGETSCQNNAVTSSDVTAERRNI